MMRVMLGVGMSLCAVVAVAAPRASDVLYVSKFEAKGVAQDEAGTIESSVCTAASQDGRFVVKCRDTNATLMDVRTTQAALGFEEGAAFKDDCGKGGCMDTLSKGTDAKWVLGGSVSKVAEKQYLLTLMVSDPASNAQLNRVEEKISGELSAVVDRIPGAVRKVLTPPQVAKPAAAAAPAPAKK